jgi:hypothetical protein
MSTEGCLAVGKNGKGVKLITYIPLVPRLFSQYLVFHIGRRYED